MVAHSDSDQRRLKRAQADAAAFSAEVRAVITAQRHQIAVLEKQAQQLANEAAAEQRFSSAIVANEKSSKLARLQQEHSGLGSDLDLEGRRAIDLAARLEAVDAGRTDMRTSVAQLEQQRLASTKGKAGPMHLKLQRALSGVDECLAQAGRLREEVDHLRREKLVFLGKLRGIEVQLEDERAAQSNYVGGIRDMSGKRESALSHARTLAEQSERRSHQRAVQRQAVNGRLDAVEKQARQVRSKLRGKMVSNSVAAGASGAALHKLRLQKSVWPPPGDAHGMLAGVPAPHTLREHVAVLAYLIGVPEDLELVCEKMAAEDREQQARTAHLESGRRALLEHEEANERRKRELAGLEATGGTDSGESLTLREQLTEMQAQGVQIRAHEERHAATLEHLSASAAALLGQLDPEAAHEPRLGGAARDVVAHMLDAAVAAAKRRFAPQQ